HGPLAYTLNGTYQGISLPDLSQEVFLGIPYANSSRRLHLASSLNETWNGTRSATDQGATCPGATTQYAYGWAIAEDCLNFNLVRPAGVTPNQSLPVMVWIYGGGFYQGAARDPEFNQSWIVQTSQEIGLPVIVITLNSRLSAWGYMNSEQAIRQGVANLGLRDVWKHLEWLHENIRGFGGDPSRITVMGQSSGGLTVEMLAMAYSGQHSLFNNGITSSITLFSPFWSTITAQQSLYQDLLNITGCYYDNDSMECLRGCEYIIASLEGGGKGWRPVVDGDFLKNSPYYQFANQQIANIPLLVGSNSDEGLSTFQTASNTDDELAAALQTQMGVNATMAQELLALYPADEGAQYPPYSQPMDLDWINLTAAVGTASGNMTRRAYAMGGDWSSMSGRRLTASRWGDATRGSPVYSYRFDTDVHRFPLTTTGLGFSQHGADLSYDFRLPYVPYTDNFPLANVSALQNVSYAIQATWISFASTDSPNHHGLEWVPAWPEYTASKQNMVWNGTLDNTLNIHIENDTFRQDQIQWWMDHWGYLL
ncbi:hypothetical protein M406DRAFT_228286, partial [Cryphonectria parasitica EP155]